MKEFINISHECLDRHLLDGRGDHIALKVLGPDRSIKSHPSTKEITYRDLLLGACRFSFVLKKLGLQKRDVLYTLSSKSEELFTVALGALRAGLIYSPLFSSFGPGPLVSRIKKGEGKVIFSLSSIFRKKLLPVLDLIPELKYFILINDDGLIGEIPGAIDYHEVMKSSEPWGVIERTTAQDLATLHFTSGTTGEPKGALHVHGCIEHLKTSGELALDLRAGDLFWCTADPGWVTGSSYGIFSPLTLGSTLLIDPHDFNTERWYQILSSFPIDVWYTAPTALRMLMRGGEELPKKFHFYPVRFAASVGEPLNPEVIKWVDKHLGIFFHDNWWQTETGGIVISNYSGLSVKIGSMGQAIPGVEVSLLKEIKKGELVFSGPGEVGEIIIKKNLSSLFVSYLGEKERYDKTFKGEWYLTGDLARRDEDNYYWFMGRGDDVIKTSGHLVGPFEVESALMSHPDVLEAGVVGLPAPLIGEMIYAFVVLKKDRLPSEELKREILSFVRKELGPALSPRVIKFVEDLPKTRSGKIMRRLLRARELGLSEGDLSMLVNHHE